MNRWKVGRCIYKDYIMRIICNPNEQFKKDQWFVPCLKMIILKRGKIKVNINNIEVTFIAPSEDDQTVIDTQKTAHPPILEYYSKNDELGPEYQKVIKKVANEIITEPKTVIELNETAHANDLVTKATQKDKVRANIIKWLKKYN